MPFLRVYLQYTNKHMPRPSKGCLLVVFVYLKISIKHPLEGAGVFLFVFSKGRPGPHATDLRDLIGKLLPEARTHKSLIVKE